MSAKGFERAGRNPVKIVCVTCGTSVWKRLSEANSKFCSRACAQKFNGPPWKPGAGPKARAAELAATATTRFWERIVKAGPDKCWEWTGDRDKFGYGHVSWVGKPMLAHRVALSLTDGQWANSLSVCHSCDNPSCCNPAHLWRGTQRDNSLDMVRKGRIGPRQRGEDKPNTRLTEAMVIAIRNSSLPGSKLAAMYGIGKTTVLTIKRRETWRHVP